MVEGAHSLVGDEEEMMMMLEQEGWLNLVVMKNEEDDGLGGKGYDVVASLLKLLPQQLDWHMSNSWEEASTAGTAV
ncbi:hypothetical protein RJT34_27288 [Clitoria ternatea]|uniref:Uncharacterized protein n=1 Tax=Clitoria ternatea TaxID=43366 RepID=A0AAN9F9P8_CLITE